MSPLVALREVTPGPAKERPARTGNRRRTLKRGQNDHPTRMVVLSEHSEPKDLSQMLNKPRFAPKLFSFTHFPKNTSATLLESHTFKTKDLKPFRFTHLQKSGGGSPHLATVVTPSEPAIFAGDEGSRRSESRGPQPA